MRRSFALCVLVWGSACEADPSTQVSSSAAQQLAKSPAPSSQPAPTKQPARTGELSAGPAQHERAFGAPLTVSGQPIDVAQVLANPEPHLGKVIKCEGTVARVCEKAGCWMEIKAASDHEGLRVPMAGHAFFIPQDAVGQRAVVEGELKASPLSAEARAHLESEGLKAVGPLSLIATSVVVR